MVNTNMTVHAAPFTTWKYRHKTGTPCKYKRTHAATNSIGLNYCAEALL